MTRFSTKILEEFSFCVLISKPFISALKNLRSQIFKISDLLSKSYDYKKINNHNNLINFRLNHQEIQYKAIKFL